MAGTTNRSDSGTPVQETVQERGVVRLPGFLEQEDIAVLVREADLLLARPSLPWSDYKAFAKSGEWKPSLFSSAKKSTVLYDFVGLSPHMDQILNKVLGEEFVREMLYAFLGEQYRLWYATIRRNEPNTESLRMHQDVPGEFTLVILTNATNAEGATIFIPRSHRWPRGLNYFPFIRPKHVSRFAETAKGDPGDIYFFDNATWHGRNQTRTDSYTSIFLTFLPAKSDHWTSSSRQPPESLYKPELPELSRVLFPLRDVNHQD